MKHLVHILSHKNLKNCIIAESIATNSHCCNKSLFIAVSYLYPIIYICIIIFKM